VVTQLGQKILTGQREERARGELMESHMIGSANGPARTGLADRLVGWAKWLKRRFGRVRYDAMTHPAEAYYGSIYLEVINAQLSELESPSISILEAGCGTGRILVPLAQLGHRVTGIDHNRDSLRIARDNARKAGVSAVFVDADVSEHLQHYDDGEFDAVLAIESLYTNRNYIQCMNELARIIRRHGLLIVSHRTRYYCMLQCLMAGDMEGALLVACRNDGRLRTGWAYRVYYNWQSAADLDRLYRGLGMDIVLRQPIGPYSGFPPDSLAGICDPGKLSGDRQKILRQIELEHSDPDTLMAARYVLVAARKS
jgi:ubiquinone/menaquinone biosynthesis C-methylase UbiE